VSEITHVTQALADPVELGTSRRWLTRGGGITYSREYWPDDLCVMDELDSW
jgi:hypothetical protein